MTGLNRRLCRLENATGRECPECGSSPVPVEDFEVTWHDLEDAEPIEPEWCGTCGEQTVFVVGWVDLEPEQSPMGPGVG